MHIFFSAEKLKLVLPGVEYKKSFLKLSKKAVFLREKIPWFVKFGPYDFEGIVKILNDHSKSLNLKKDEVPSTTFFAVFGKCVAGVINIKHRLSEKNKNYGHIGYYVFAPFRKKGVATKMLQLALVEAKNLNLKTLTVCVDKNNFASRHVILKNHFRHQDEFYDEIQKTIIERYVIKLDD